VYNAEHPELADEVLALKMATIYDVDADLLVSGNPGCLLQLAYGLKKDNSGMHLAHPVELVAGQYGDEVIARIERY
jgi:glycolate oxidase iron-sulfur subunit